MTELIACLSSDKGTSKYVAKLINDYDWNNIIVITNELGGKSFKSNKPLDFVIIDSNNPLVFLAKDIKEKLSGKIKGIEVAVNFVSGDGKEHMALMSALLKLGIGVRFIALKPEGIEEI